MIQQQYDASVSGKLTLIWEQLDRIANALEKLVEIAEPVKVNLEIPEEGP
jgi:hypothetical protein